MTKEAAENKRVYMREYMRKYRQENREKLNAKKREWNAKNPDKIKAYNNAYWEKKSKMVT